MKRVLFSILVGWLALAQQADVIVLLETSQYTCGKPTQTAVQVLRELLCNRSPKRVALGTFYRKGERGYVDWKTTPVLEGGGKPCSATLQTIKSRCDSVYVVHLLGALETALRGDYVQAPVVVVLASGMDMSPGLKDSDILKLARKNNVRIHALSMGYLANNDQAQSLLKRISGQFEEGAGGGLYQVVNPQSGSYQTEMEEFLYEVLTRGGGEKAASDKAASLSSEGGPAAPETEGGIPPVPQPSGPDYTLWILIGAGALVLIGLIVVLATRKSAPPPPAPAAPPSPPSPAVQASPVPTLRRLVIHYPHGTQEVQLSPSPAPITLGRAPDNTIVISDPTISGRHARLYLQGSQWYIQDLGSTNGTFVNNVRVTQYPVHTGDQIRLGAIVIQIG